MPYLVFDLEMSGSESDYHDIIEIGAVLCDNSWKKLSEFESLVYPDNPEAFSKISEDVHGISLEDLEDAPVAYDVIEDFENWIRKTLKKEKRDPLYDIILCGQSVINDINFLNKKYSELNINWPFSAKMIDLLTITFIFYEIFDANNIKRPRSMSLKSVSEFFNVQREDGIHTALEDAEITYFCLKEYMNLAKSLKMNKLR